MQSNFSHRSSIIRWTTLAFLGLCFVEPTAHAQAQIAVPEPAPASAAGKDSIWIDLGSSSLGIVPGQTLRISVLNPLAASGEDGPK